MLTEQDRANMATMQQHMLSTGFISKKFLRYVCRECIYDPNEKGTSRSQILGCTVDSCPLHPLRGMWT